VRTKLTNPRIFPCLFSSLNCLRSFQIRCSSAESFATAAARSGPCIIAISNTLLCLTEWSLILFKASSRSFGTRLVKAFSHTSLYACPAFSCNGWRSDSMFASCVSAWKYTWRAFSGGIWAKVWSSTSRGCGTDAAGAADPGILAWGAGELGGGAFCEGSASEATAESATDTFEGAAMYRCVITATPPISTTAAAHQSDTTVQRGKRPLLGDSTASSTISVGFSVGKGGGAVNTKLWPQLVHFAFLPMASVGALRRLEQFGQATVTIVRFLLRFKSDLRTAG
jgi:hypothetical protein